MIKIGTKTLANLRDQLSLAIGDYLHSTVTTALTTSTAIVDTALANVEGGWVTDFWEGWWAIITSENNASAVRSISAYNASTWTLTARGLNFTSDVAAKATYELHRINPTEKTRAINNAARELYPTLFKKIVDRTLIAGNVLPDGSFEDWSSATALTFYTTTSNATMAKTTTAGLYRGSIGTTSAKITAGADNAYFAIDSDIWPKLLDLGGQTIDFKARAYPQTANDAKLEIYTVEKDGTATTTTSTTTAVVAEYTPISILDHAVPDDLDYIAFRFKVATSGQYVYFDDAQVTGPEVLEYVFPASIKDGAIKEVRMQTSGNTDDYTDDVGMVSWQEVFGCQVKDDGTYKYLRLPYWIIDRRIEVIGKAPLEDNLSADTSTMSIDDPYTNLLIAQACWELYRQLRGFPSSQATDRYDSEIAYWAAKAAELKRTHRMYMPVSQIAWSL